MLGPRQAGNMKKQKKPDSMLAINRIIVNRLNGIRFRSGHTNNVLEDSYIELACLAQAAARGTARLIKCHE